MKTPKINNIKNIDALEKFNVFQPSIEFTEIELFSRRINLNFSNQKNAIFTLIHGKLAIVAEDSEVYLKIS